MTEETSLIPDVDPPLPRQNTGVGNEASHTRRSLDGSDARKKHDEDEKTPSFDIGPSAVMTGDEVVTVSTTQDINQIAAPPPPAHTDATARDDDKSAPMSKNQMKKRRRIEKARAHKEKRKREEKEAKRARAIAAGRDLDAERMLQEERTRLGEGRRRRESLWKERTKKADTSFGVCIDCSFEDQMTTKEISSLAVQIRYAYAENKRSPNPCRLYVSSLSGATYENLCKVSGFPDNWKSRAFCCSEKSVIEMIPDTSQLIYLTSDSENTLEDIDDTKTYVIGGIVDRNRLKRASITRAEALGVRTARLPITSYLKLFSTKVLTCNHVFEILLKYRQHNNEWKKAMLSVLPQRKDILLNDDSKSRYPDITKPPGAEGGDAKDEKGGKSEANSSTHS